MEKKYELTKFEKQAQERVQLIVNQYCGGSQQKLADIASVNKASISQYINGKNVPSTFTAEKLCKPFGLNPVWLMGFDVPMQPPQTLGPDSGDMSDGRNLYYQEIIPVLQKLSKENLHKVVSYAEKLYDIQLAEDELK